MINNPVLQRNGLFTLNSVRNVASECGKLVRGAGHADHFIPWSRYPVDLGHNFVFSHPGCNNDKSDLLANAGMGRNGLPCRRGNFLQVTQTFTLVPF